MNKKAIFYAFFIVFAWYFNDFLYILIFFYLNFIFKIFFLNYFFNLFLINFEFIIAKISHSCFKFSSLNIKKLAKIFMWIFSF